MKLLSFPHFSPNILAFHRRGAVDVVIAMELLSVVDLNKMALVITFLARLCILLHVAAGIMRGGKR